MAAISKARHYKLTADIKSLLSKLLSSAEANQRLENDMLQLEMLFEKYQHNLAQIHELIKAYDVTQKNIKIELRKQQISSAKQKVILNAIFE